MPVQSTLFTLHLLYFTGFIMTSDFDNNLDLQLKQSMSFVCICNVWCCTHAKGLQHNLLLFGAVVMLYTP